MNAARYYYSQDAIELIIVKIEPSDDDPYYEIKTKKLVKKYIFWGDLVDKLESVYAGYDDKYLVELAKFKTAEQAERVARSLTFDRVSIVKTISVK